MKQARAVMGLWGREISQLARELPGARFCCIALSCHCIVVLVVMNKYYIELVE
jgi:hypothetical protein